MEHFFCGIDNKEMRVTGIFGNPVVRTCAFTAGAQFQSLIGQLRSLKPCGVPPPPKKNNHKIYFQVVMERTMDKNKAR